jgi:cytochrome c-type biogenesis protein
MGEAMGVFLLGLAYGATVCSLTCLPCLGTFLMGCGNGFRDGLIAGLFFMFGKVAIYTIFGGLAGMLGHVLTLTAEQQRIIPGCALIGAAFILPFMTTDGCRQRRSVPGKKSSLMLLGMATSLVPCPPLAAVFLLAARQGTCLAGGGYGFLYGTGLMLSPLLIAGGGLALIAKRIRVELGGSRVLLRAAAMLVMIIMGLQTLSAS